jgi:hypothetical protein
MNHIVTLSDFITKMKNAEGKLLEDFKCFTEPKKLKMVPKGSRSIGQACFQSPDRPMQRQCSDEKIGVSPSYPFVQIFLNKDLTQIEGPYAELGGYQEDSSSKTTLPCIVISEPLLEMILSQDFSADLYLSSVIGEYLSYKIDRPVSLTKHLEKTVTVESVATSLYKGGYVREWMEADTLACRYGDGDEIIAMHEQTLATLNTVWRKRELSNRLNKLKRSVEFINKMRRSHYFAIRYGYESSLTYVVSDYRPAAFIKETVDRVLGGGGTLPGHRKNSFLSNNNAIYNG